MKRKWPTKPLPLCIKHFSVKPKSIAKRPAGRFLRCRDAWKNGAKGRKTPRRGRGGGDEVWVKTGMVYEPFTLTIETKEAYRRIYGTDYLTD